MYDRCDVYQIDITDESTQEVLDDLVYVVNANAEILKETLDRLRKIERNSSTIEINATQMIDKSNFDRNQYKADIQSAHNCDKLGMIKHSEEELISRLEKLKGNSGCDYHRNVIINECICGVSNYFSELRGESK